MRRLVLTPKFERAFRKFVKRNAKLQERVENALEQMQIDAFAPQLGTHNSGPKLMSSFLGRNAISCSKRG